MRCRVCDKVLEGDDLEFKPFCSDRCRLIDLGAWVTGEYKIPGCEVIGDEEMEKEQLDD